MNDTTITKPFLSPIEKPKGLLMKIGFFFIRRRFGRVFTPLKVHSTRMPTAIFLFYGKLGQLDKKLSLTPETALLVRHQVARTNGCSFCIDAQRWAALKSGVNAEKLDALDDYKNSHLFSEKERAALDYATILTRDKQVQSEDFDRLARSYSEREICEIVWLIASEHLYNITNIGLNIHSDGFCDSSRKVK